MLEPSRHPAMEPPRDCTRCPRLVGYRRDNQAAHPTFHNGPVPAFGPIEARILIVGLAPGLKGANRTARPFTGDFAGDLLYPTLLKFGLARGRYGADPDDGLELIDCRITNAVRCVPPANKPTGEEIRTCRPYLLTEIGAMNRLRAVIALGRTAHETLLSALGRRRAAFPFSHGALHRLSGERTLVMADSYHCSRYNTNTGRLTEKMFESVFENLLSGLD